MSELDLFLFDKKLHEAYQEFLRRFPSNKLQSVARKFEDLISSWDMWMQKNVMKNCKNCGKSIPESEYNNPGYDDRIDLSGLCYRCAVNSWEKEMEQHE